MTDTDARGETDGEDEDGLDRLFPFEEDPEDGDSDDDGSDSNLEDSNPDADSASNAQGNAGYGGSTTDRPAEGESEDEVELKGDVTDDGEQEPEANATHETNADLEGDVNRDEDANLEGDVNLDGDVELGEETLGPVRAPGQTGSTAGGFDGDLSSLGDDTRIERDEPPEQPAGNRLSTGIEPLDRQLEGGIPPGRLVTFVAPPDTQSELLIKELATQRNTLYLSTIRPRWEIEEELRDHIQRNHEAGDARDARIEQLPTDARLETARTYIDDLDNRSLLIVNAANELETEAEHRYAEFLNAVKEALWDTASIGLFYQIKDEQSPPGRTITLRRSDLVWELHKSMKNTGIDNFLEVSKFRGGSALGDPLKLKLTDEVEIDTSRDIA